MTLIGRIWVVVGTATAGLLVSAAPAFAHVTANPREATADGFTYHAFRSVTVATVRPPPRSPSRSPLGWCR